jgi:hypothetical protein
MTNTDRFWFSSFLTAITGTLLVIASRIKDIVNLLEQIAAK